MNNGNGRYLRWLIGIGVAVTLGSVPVYIYVLEVHSSHLGRIDTHLENIGVRVSHLEANAYPRPCGPPLGGGK